MPHFYPVLGEVGFFLGMTQENPLVAQRTREKWGTHNHFSITKIPNYKILTTP
jgi:hypothetical protein